MNVRTKVTSMVNRFRKTKDPVPTYELVVYGWVYSEYAGGSYVVHDILVMPDMFTAHIPRIGESVSVYDRDLDEWEINKFEDIDKVFLHNLLVTNVSYSSSGKVQVTVESRDCWKRTSDHKFVTTWDEKWSLAYATNRDWSEHPHPYHDSILKDAERLAV